MINEDLTLVTTKDGEQIAIWEISNDIKSNPSANDQPAQKKQNIFLTHGTFSDRKVCMGIASYLATLGHTCYIMEWRGHGHSSIPREKFNFETVATYDYEAAFRYLFEERKLCHLHCVTHSGGGIGLTMFLIQNEHYISKISSVSIFACQAYGAVLNATSYFKILAAKILTKLLGHLPAKRLGLGPTNESYETMNQWFDWNLNKNFKSSFINNYDIDKHAEFQNRRFDYRQHMTKVAMPIYAISGKGDRFVSPTLGCQLFFDHFGNVDNVFIEYSIANGHLEDYDHTRVLMSRNAANEIWPTVAAWIETHSKS